MDSGVPCIYDRGAPASLLPQQCILALQLSSYTAETGSYLVLYQDAPHVLQLHICLDLFLALPSTLLVFHNIVH